MTFVISAFQMYVLQFGHLFENRKKTRVSNRVKNDDPVTRWPGRERWPKWSIDQVTQWPSSMSAQQQTSHTPLPHTRRAASTNISKHHRQATADRISFLASNKHQLFNACFLFTLTTFLSNLCSNLLLLFWCYTSYENLKLKTLWFISLIADFVLLLFLQVASFSYRHRRKW